MRVPKVCFAAGFRSKLPPRASRLTRFDSVAIAEDVSRVNVSETDGS